ncbi:MAG: alpha-ketoglutarate-dependent dioxygenase AlkB [Blastocatellia bacterium]|nr:alpha-ketoglutarate-dependent dioxygenase AlkB [Blastocatellia bacterium]
MKTRVLDMPDGEAALHEGFFAPEECVRLMQSLLAETAWGQGEIRIYGRRYAEPRLTAWHGDEGKSYSYSGIVLQPRPWTPLLAGIRERVDAAAGAPFNSVLLNLYRDGRDSNGWHQDNEPELGENPVIASVSFGATRRFQLRHKVRRELPRIDLDLEDGSLLLMAGATQHFWQHQIPKTARPVGARINLTFRVIQ